jgi:cytochrome c oxidase subunit III
MTNATFLNPPIEPSPWILPSRRKMAIACLILSESAMFTIFVVAYLFYAGKSLTGPFPSDVLETPIVPTICLLSSSLTIVIATRAFGRGRSWGFRFWWGLTILLAAIFLGSTALEWKRLIVEHHLTISANLFGTAFYSLVGLHASHVIVGLTLLTLVLVFSLTGSVKRANGERIEMISWYWHFVDAVWVVVFTVVYIVCR